MRVLYPGRIEIWSVSFCGGRKTGEPGEKPSGKDENQQQTQPTYDTGTELNPAEERKVLMGNLRSLSLHLVLHTRFVCIYVYAGLKVVLVLLSLHRIGQNNPFAYFCPRERKDSLTKLSINITNTVL